MKLMRRVVVEVAAESVYGTDPATGYQVLLTRSGTQITPAGDLIQRDTLRDTLTPRGHVIGMKQVDLQIPVELRGAGTTAGALNDPEVNYLLLACGLRKSSGSVITLTSVTGTFAIGETVINTTALDVAVGTVADFDSNTLYLRDVTNVPAVGNSLTGNTSAATGTVSAERDALVYRRQSDPDLMGSATLRYFMDGIRHVVPGSRGTFGININVGQIPELVFTMTGLYSAPTDASAGTASYSSVVPKPAFGAGVVMGATDLSAVAISALAFNFANTISPRDDVKSDQGRLGFQITDCDPNGSIDPEVSTLAVFDPWADWAAASERKVSVQIGDTDGERVRLVSPKAIFRDPPSYNDRNGIAAYALGFGMTGDSDDELYVIYS